MFWIRLRSGILLVIVAIALIMSGGAILLAGLAVISLIGLFELYRVVGIEKSPLGGVGYLSVLVYYFHVYNKPGSDNIPVFFFLLFLTLFLAVYVFAFPKYKTEQVVTAFFGIFYVPVMLSYIFRTRALDAGFLVWLIFFGSWGCDTCAYCAGMLFGKHKMAPVLSPKKSIEGAIGGVAGAACLGALFGFAFQKYLPLASAPAGCAVICAIAAVISQIGDLAASAIKRNHQVKDYGALIPGHGGILDRFDSVIFVAPMVYYTILGLQNGVQLFSLFF